MVSNNTNSLLPRSYNSFTDYIKQRFGGRIQKLTLNAGFTCPNRDGTLGTGGCIYCDNDAFNPSYCHPQKSVTKQIEEGIVFHKFRYRRAVGYLAYFQAFSNTYDSLQHLKRLYDEALSHPEVKGLIIGTRPDCIDEEKLDYFAALSSNKFVLIEYGVESCYDHTLRLINRGHTFGQSVDAIKLTHAYGIMCGIHMILGLPGESPEDILKEAEIISELPINTLKLHQLQIVKNTRLATDYRKTPENYFLLSLNDYIDLVIRFTERLNPVIMIDRFTAEIPPRFLEVPVWKNLRADEILRLIEQEYVNRNTWQGKYFMDTSKTLKENHERKY